jgi:ribosomal protein S18 acetylase RimI-like enzyme
VKIRCLTEPDVPSFRDLRLFALQESPTAFCSSYEQETRWPLADFAKKVLTPNEPDSRMFGAFTAEGRLAGMLGLLRDPRPKRAHIATLWTMYVHPEFRGQGVGAALIDESLTYARRLGLRLLILTVTDGNTAARALYAARGFQRFGLEPDALLVGGQLYDQEHMALRLAPA